MKIKLQLASSDGGDGSFNVGLHNTKQEALKSLDRTEEQIEKGTFYDDGMFEEVELDINLETGKLNESFWINIE